MLDYYKHAEVRISQRGISQRQIQLAIDYGQFAWHNGRRQYTMRDKDIYILVVSGRIRKQEIDKLHRLVVIIDAQGENLVTAYKAKGSLFKKMIRQ